MERPDTDFKSKSDRLRLALLKERADYRTLWGQYGGENLADAVSRYKKSGVVEKITCNFNNGLARFGIEPPFPVRGPVFNLNILLDVLNPYKEVPEEIPFGIKFSSDQRSICQILQQEPDDLWQPFETTASFYDKESTISLKPSERLLRVDLSNKRSKLISDFINFLDDVNLNRNAFLSSETPEGKLHNIFLNYSAWEQKKTRFRKESWQHLKVWKMRRQRKSYAIIAHELEIKIPAAKKSFARAFELIEGRKYDPTFFKDYKKIHLHELNNPCEDCPERATCPELCPDALQYANQDQVKQHHLIPKNPIL